MFYEFRQNNSGGSFDVNDKLCHVMIIEADTEAEAVNKAEELGCYWDDVVWTSADGRRDIVLDCEYELDDIEFEVNGELYIVKIIKE
jgi:hypothetical protein